MRQRSLENLLPTTDESCECYSFGFHYSTPEGKQELLSYLRVRFEIWHICVEEISDTGLRHLQCYGETKTKISKSERQMFQGKGKYRKYLNTDVRKCWWFSESRTSRHRNVMYILKDVKRDGHEERVIELNQHIDVAELLAWIDESAKLQNEMTENVVKKPLSYHEKLVYWYRDLPLDERPTRVVTMIEKLIRSKMVPWQNLPERSLVSAAEYILLTCTTGDVYERAVSDKLARCKDFYDRNLY